MTTVLLVTGWASPKEIWSRVCSVLSDECLLQVVTGHEILEFGPSIWKRFSGEKLICVGWSMGGMLLVEAISEGLIDCMGLVLVSSCSRVTSSNGLLERTLKAMRKKLETEPNQVVTEFWRSVGSCEQGYISYAQNQPTLSEGLAYLAERDLSSKLSLINVPTTVIHGSMDTIVPLELGKQLADGISDSKFISLKAGHDLPLSTPELIADEIRSIAGAKQKLEFSKSAKTYDRWAEPQRVIGENLLAVSEKWLRNESEVLDVGCGTGFMIAALKRRYPRTKITGLDSAPGMIDFCKDRFRDCADVAFSIGKAEINLPDGPWDFIVSNSMLQWAGDLRSCLTNWKKELSIDGKIIFSTLVSGSFTEFEESYLKVVGRKSSSLSWRESDSYLELLEELNLNTDVQEERSFTFSYKSALEALNVFKRIGAINKQEKPLTVSQTRELIKYYQDNFPAALGGVQVSYKALFVVAGGK